jgi:ABC-2 type transport system permease protein
MTATATRPAAAARPAAASRGLSTFAGTGRLVRFMLRRDRVRLSVWTASMVAFYAYFTAALDTVFADEASRQARAAVMETPAGIVMGGPNYGLENYTTGVAMANEGITWVVLALAILSILHIVRHTRAEEESGRSELVRAAVVGRHAPAVAAMVTLIFAQAVIAVLSALAMYGVSEGSLDLTNSFAMTIGSGLSALVFGAVALVFCQVTEHGRGATGMSLAVFGAAFVARAVGDMQERGGSALSWFSPIAWAQQMRAFDDLRWWPALLSVAAIGLLLWLSSVLASRRDFGGGLVATRPGRADAPASLRSPFALAWVQQRSALLWSCLGLGLMWYASGTLMPEIGTMIGDVVESNPVAQQIFGDDPSALGITFLGIMILYAALACAAYAIVMALRPKAEESSGRVEVALALPVSRTRWLGAQLAVAGLGTLVLLAVSVYALWAGAVAVGWDDQSFGEYTTVLWTHVPALLVYLGFTAALFAWLPKASGVAWALLAYTFVIGLFGGLFELPDWAFRISPFDWVPTPFVDDVAAGDLLVLWGAAAVLLVIAFVGFRRRDVVST